MTRLGHVSRDVVERLVAVAKLSKNATARSDELKLTDEEMQAVVCLSLTQQGARHLTGATRLSHFERVLSRQLTRSQTHENLER